MPGGLPGMGEDPMEDMPLLDEPTLSPASAGGGAGGGSGGGGGGGVPSIPLQPNVGGVSVGPSPTAGAGGAGGGGAAGGGAGGGMMGGGMPMGGAGAGHGQGGGGSEKKRTPGLSPDEDLYSEDRPWTEAVIGNRPRRKDVTEGKDSK